MKGAQGNGPARTGTIQNNTGDLNFPSLSRKDREMVREALTSPKNTVEEALEPTTETGRMVA